jgi:hypothetical protein
MGDRSSARQRFERGDDRALQHRRLARTHREKARHERERPALGGLHGARDPVGAPELAVHRLVRVVERQLAHGARRRLRGRDHHMIERLLPAEKRIDGGGVGRVERAVRTPCPIRAAASASFCALRDAIVTCAPSAAKAFAAAALMPELPPTISTRFD